MPERIPRDEGRHLFGLDPQGYEDSRPDYPGWIYDRLRDVGALVPGTATLEIGAGTGRATRRLLEYGADPLTIVEPDERFAAMLRAASDASGAACNVHHVAFEDAPLPAANFDLIAAGTAFHWIEPVPGLKKARRLLKPGGAVALFWNVLQILNAEDTFHAATATLLSSLAVSPSGPPESIPYALDRRARESDAAAAGFESVDYAESRWRVVLEPEQIGKLYEGFSHIQRLDAATRAEVLQSLIEIAEREFDGQVERNVTSCLYVLR